MQNSIMQAIIENPDVTTQAIAEMMGLSRRKIEYNIDQLKMANLIERVGARKKGRWIVKG